MFAFAMAVVVPLLVGVMFEGDHTKIRQRWDTLFYTTSALYAIGPIPFLFFGTDKQQKWDKALQNEEVESGYKNEEVAMQ